jgi:hypothetical protein
VKVYCVRDRDPAGKVLEDRTLRILMLISAIITTLNFAKVIWLDTPKTP